MERIRAGSDLLDRDEASVADDRETSFLRFAEHRLAQQYRLAAVILGDPVEAQDATHDAFVLAWRRWGSLRDPARLDAWFGRILLNVCRDRLRNRRRHALTDLSAELAESLTAADELRGHADRDEISRAFETLNPDQRMAIVLRYYADLTVDQIADRVGAPSGTVKSRLHHALAALSAALAAGREGGTAR